jgi:hypothetical protein
MVGSWPMGVSRASYLAILEPEDHHEERHVGH